jgi:hypothetical protein
MGCNNEPHGIKMQPTTHPERKAGFGRGKNPALPAKRIVGRTFNSVELIITRESPCLSFSNFNRLFLLLK